MRKSSRIPNFRNLGIHLRVLLLHVGVLAVLAVLRWQVDESLTSWSEDVAGMALLCLPPLLLTLGIWYLIYPSLSACAYRVGLGGLVLTAMLLCLLAAKVYDICLSPLAASHWLQVLLVCLADVAACLYYLDLLQCAYSPAIAEARLQALQARIRPHFLFNSLNAVLSLIRSQPQRAETALEDMAELFRVLMADNRALVPLAQEIQLCRQYINIEKLRLDQRLQCDWQLAAMPAEVLIPPLILQPLLENAVYHGIEPLPEGGCIVVKIHTSGNSLHIRISNPLPPSSDKATGNRMAMKNIQERLRLHYDLEAHFSQSIKRLSPMEQHEMQSDGGAYYVVEISLPLRGSEELEVA